MKVTGKRGLYTGVQHKSLVAAESDIIIPYRTGYETIMPYKVGDKYCTNATEDGIVKKVSKQQVIITYKSGEKKYNLKKWTSKESGGKTYSHQQVTSLKEGDRIKEGDNILYDEMFFQPDYLNPGKVAFKTGTLARVAFDESDETYEDASSVSLALHNKLATKIVSVKDRIIPLDVALDTVVHIGDKVQFNTTLLSFRGADMTGNDELSETSKAILEDISTNKFKAEAKGTVINLEVYYNIDEEMTIPKSMQEFIEYADKINKKNKGLIGKVDNTFSIKGKPLRKGTMYVRYYIEKKLKLHSGDKYKIANQLKTTVGTIYNETKTVSGKQVDLIYSKRGEAGRIVGSPTYMGTTLNLLEEFTNMVVKAYES